MDTGTIEVRRTRREAGSLDDFDRKLLRLLLADATRSYAELGRAIGLSPPAVHERVRKMRRHGVIQATTVVLDGTALGRPLLSFVHVDTEGWGKTPAMMALADRPEVEEIHAVAGDTCLILKVRCAGPQALEDLLHDVYAIPGVKSTRSYIALSSRLERGPQP